MMESVILNGYTVMQVINLTRPLYGIFKNGIAPLIITRDIQKVVEFCYKTEKGMK